MLDAIRKHTQGWLAKTFLAIIALLFVLGGIDSYLNQAGKNIAVAKIGREQISIQEYGNALETVRNRLQADGEKVDAAMLESAAFKQNVLDGLITRKLVNAEINRSNFKVSDAQLSDHILAMPEFQDKGKFSEELYQKTLEQNKLTAKKFENSIRGDLLTQQARDGLARLVFVPKTVAAKNLELSYQQRDISTSEIKASEFISQVKITPEQIKAYYDLHKDKFKVPEQVKLEFGLLSAAALVGQMSVTDDEIKAFYDENAAKFQGDEQRQASHILISFGVNASADEKAKAKQKALDVLAQVKKDPKKFAELATKYSQDPGSAAKGGDLGSFGRGAMVKPFEEAVFSMKPGQVSDLVESEFGYHIIKLVAITGTSSSFDSMKPQIKGELLFQKAQAKYAELSEDFSNTVYEQSGSLQPAAKKFNLQLQTSGWLSREDLVKYFKSEKLAAMVFSDEVLKNKRNTEAVEVSPNNMISARLVDYKPSAPKTFDEVKPGIEAVLKLEAAIKLAKEKGDATLAKLKSGANDDTLTWSPPVSVNRKDAQGYTDVVMNNVYKLNVDKLPAYAGFTDGNRAYVLLKVSAVSNLLEKDKDAKETAEREYEAIVAAENVSAYGKSLKSKVDIVVNPKYILGGTAQ